MKSKSCGRRRTRTTAELSASAASRRATCCLRDFTIIFVVDDVCWEFGEPTQSIGSRREMSRCKIVSRAVTDEVKGLAIGERAVVKSWTKYGYMAFPGSKFGPDMYFDRAC